MLVAAALVPDTALIVPGVAGAADPARALAAAAARAVLTATRGVDVVVVVAPGPADRALTGDVRGTFAPVGVPDSVLRGPAPVVTARAPAATDLATSGGTPSPATAVAVHLMAGAGVGTLLDACSTDGAHGPLVHVVEVADAAATSRADVLRDLGRALVQDAAGSPATAAAGAPVTNAAAGPAHATGTRTALVVVGSPSGRHGPDAPLADDDRAPAHDAVLLADLADAGPQARARLAAADPVLAAELAVTGWAPWQVLVGAADGSTVTGELLHAEVLAGAQHAVALWRCA